MGKILYSDLLSFCERLLELVGFDKDSIKSVSCGLCEASLRGVDSHGIRLLPHYIDSTLFRKYLKPDK